MKPGNFLSKSSARIVIDRELNYKYESFVKANKAIPSGRASRKKHTALFFYNGKKEETAFPLNAFGDCSKYPLRTLEKCRLTTSTYGWQLDPSVGFSFTKKYNEENITYDHNGNLLLLNLPWRGVKSLLFVRL